MIQLRQKIIGAAMALLPAISVPTAPQRLFAVQVQPGDRQEALQVLQGATHEPFITEDDIAAVVRALAAIRSGFPEIRGIQAGHNDTELFLYLSDDAWAEMQRRAPDARPGDELPRVYNFAVDSIAAALGMRSVILDDPLFRRVKILASRPLNVPIAAKRFDNLAAVEWAGSEIYVGDGDFISAQIDGASLHLTFRHGWGDCLAGCINERRYLFVYDRRTAQAAKVGETVRSILPPSGA